MDLPYKTPEPSRLNAPEFVQLLDELIIHRVVQHSGCFTGSHLIYDEKSQLLKRELTDYLLATDPRKGIYAKGPND